MPSSPGRLVLCPDVTSGRGLGHLQRSLALGEAWQRAGGEAVVVVSGTPDAAGDSGPGATEIAARIEAVGERAESARIPVVGTVPAGADWIVLDGYDVSAEDQGRSRTQAFRVGLIDDHGRMAHHDADLVLDQNLGAVAGSYGPEAGRVLLGLRYALLREAFAAQEPFWHPNMTPEEQDQVPERGATRPLDLLVTLGGSPGAEERAFVADTITLLDLPADSVGTVGPLGRPTTKRGEAVPSLGRPTDLAEALAATRVALSAAGSTAWELCATGTPAVLVAVADNQEPIGQALADAGVADHLGSVEQADPQRAAAAVDALLADTGLWHERCEAGRRLVDGRGADRVVAAMRALDIDLRPADADDARTLWEWANDATVRASAFDPTPIPWDDHVAWLHARLADSGTSIYVATEGGEPWAQVRLDAVDSAQREAEVDVSIAADCRGRGLAGPLLDAAVTQTFRERPDLHRVTARVKADNAASLRAFDRAGFVLADGDAARGDEIVTLYRERADV